MQTLRNFIQNEEGATMVEYGLMLALIAVVCLAAVAIVGNETSDTFTNVGTSLQNANAS